MISSLESRAVSLHNKYLPYRVDGVPFPGSSVAFFSLFLALQEGMGITGDMIEVGVQHGGTAFLTIAALQAGEKQVLVDVKRTTTFNTRFGLLPEEVKRRITFFVADSHMAIQTVSTVTSCARFIHIDGGHQKSDVLVDAADYIPFLANDGVICFDDVFEIRWPGVTEALIEAIPMSHVVPVALVDRKLYCCRQSAYERYFANLSRATSSLNRFGTVRTWTESFLGSPTLIIKIKPNAKTAKAEL